MREKLWQVKPEGKIVPEKDLLVALGVGASTRGAHELPIIPAIAVKVYG